MRGEREGEGEGGGVERWRPWLEREMVISVTETSVDRVYIRMHAQRSGGKEHLLFTK